METGFSQWLITDYHDIYIKTILWQSTGVTTGKLWLLMMLEWTDHHAYRRPLCWMWLSSWKLWTFSFVNKQNSQHLCSSAIFLQLWDNKSMLAYIELPPTGCSQRSASARRQPWVHYHWDCRPATVRWLPGFVETAAVMEVHLVVSRDQSSNVTSVVASMWCPDPSVLGLNSPCLSAPPSFLRGKQKMESIVFVL